MLRWWWLAMLVALGGCTPEPKLAVAVSVSRRIARPILSAFERESGTALAIEHLAAGEDPPEAFAVLWSGHPETTVALARSGKLARLPESVLQTRAAGFRDRDGRWVAITADVRVIAYDPRRVEASEVPARFEDFLDRTRASRLSMATLRDPSAAWHAATLFADRGAAPAAQFYRDLVGAGAHLANTDREVLDYIAGDGPPIGVLKGETAFGGRDTGVRLEVLIPDQDSGGAVLLPSTAAIHRDAAESARAHQLLSFLTSVTVQRRITVMAGHVGLTGDPSSRPGTLKLSEMTVASPSIEETVDQLTAARQALSDLR